MIFLKSKSGMLRKRPHWVILFILAVFVLLQITSADYADAAEYQTMYLKEQSFSYRTFSTNYGYAVTVLGKGEKVSVSKKEYMVRENGKIVKYRKYLHHGLTSYIPSQQLSAKKPKYSYQSEASFYTISLQEGTSLYLTPVISENYIICRETNICTIGETNYWYKVFYEGKVCFIRKKSSDILNIKKTDSTFITIDNRISTERKNIMKRSMYYYSFLPSAIRNELKRDNCAITITDHLSKEYEKIGSSGYACSNGEIYLKEKKHNSDKKLYYLEGTILHEIGHIIVFDLLAENEAYYTSRMRYCFEEAKSLGVSSYYRKTMKEYMAEAFCIYILEPERMQCQAPRTYLFFTELMETG